MQTAKLLSYFKEHSNRACVRLGSELELRIVMLVTEH